MKVFTNQLEKRFEKEFSKSNKSNIHFNFIWNISIRNYPKSIKCKKKKCVN